MREPWDTGKKFVEFPYFSFETISLFMGRMNYGRCGWPVVSEALKTQPDYSRFVNISPKVRIATARYQALDVEYKRSVDSPSALAFSKPTSLLVHQATTSSHDFNYDMRLVYAPSHDYAGIRRPLHGYWKRREPLGIHEKPTEVAIYFNRVSGGSRRARRY